MNGWEIDSRKKLELWPMVQAWLWCLPLPFLMELKVGFDFYILGLAYYLALIRQKKWRLPAITLAVIGVLVLPTSPLRWKYGLLLMLLTAQEWTLEWKRPLLPFWKRCVFYEGGLGLTVVILSMVGVLAGYQMVTIFLEGALLFGAANLYYQVLEGDASDTELEKAGISVAIGTILAAFHWIQISSLIPAEIALLALALIASYELGIGKGMLLALPAGFVMRISLTAGEGLVILSLLLVLLAGAFREMGKKAVAVASFSGGSLWVLLFMGGNNILPGVFSVGAACLLFGLAPKAIFERQFSRRKETENREEWQRYFENQLGQGAQAFESIARLISIPAQQRRITSRDLVYLKEDIAGSLCQDCPRQKECWGRQYAQTHEVVVCVMEASRQKGRVERKDLPETFLETCLRATDFVRTVNRHYELYRLNQSWENRMAQSAQLIRSQYEAMAGYLNSMKEHFVGELSAEEAVKQKIQKQLRRQGRDARKLWVLADQRQDRVKISFEVSKPLSQTEGIHMETMLSQLTGRTMALRSSKEVAHGWYRYRFSDPNAYRVQLGVAELASETVSGDSYTARRLDEYRYVLALGDGMGSGERARKASERALALLEQLLLTGIEEEKAIRLLNTALVLSSQEEVFTTIDLALMNLHSGQLKLVKAGSCTTFLRSRAAVQVYHSSSLPVGILEEPEPETFSQSMERGDLLLMISDGVLDQLPEVRQGERWIRRYLMQTEERDPQRLAEDLQKQLMPHLPKVRDDQTILVLQIE